VPAALTIECGTPVPPAAEVWAVDGCDTEVEVDYEEEMLPGGCAGTYTLVRTWSSTDACGNTTTAGQLISVVDTEAPYITCALEDMTVGCKNIPKPIKCVAMDKCGGEIEAVMTEEWSGDNCKLGWTIVRTYTATDDCGNSSSVMQTITVEGTGFMPTMAHAGSKKAPVVNAWPNPFRDACTISFTAEEDGKATLTLISTEGRDAGTLFQGNVKAGIMQTVRLERGDHPTGIYMYRLMIGDVQTTGRLVIE
jgi:hypothetical protein